MAEQTSNEITPNEMSQETLIDPKDYAGRVTSSKKGIFYAFGQNDGIFSTLPNEDQDKYQNFHVSKPDKPHLFLEKYPHAKVQLEDDGTIKNLSLHVQLVDDNGEYHTLEQVNDSEG